MISIYFGEGLGLNQDHNPNPDPNPDSKPNPNVVAQKEMLTTLLVESLMIQLLI